MSMYWLFMPPLKKGGNIVMLMSVDWSVGPSVRLSVGRPNGFRQFSWKHFIIELSYFTCCWSWADYVKGQCQRIIFVKNGFRSFSWELFITVLSYVMRRLLLVSARLIFFWSSGIMECTYKLFTFENRVLLMR